MAFTVGLERFEWDEAKRARVLEKHGIDLADAVTIFDGPTLIAESDRLDESRWLAIGLLGEIEIAVVFTMRGDTCRLISARRARRHEREDYHARVSGSGP